MENTINLNDSDEKVIKYYSNMVYRLAFAKTGTRFDSDEIFQEVFLRYVKKKPKFNDEEHRKAWLIKVTVNCSKKFLNSSWNKKTEALNESLEFKTEEDNSLYYELQKIPAKYRQVIHLFYYENYSVEEICKVLNRKNSTVRTQLTRARKMLKAYIKEDDYV